MQGSASERWLQYKCKYNKDVGTLSFSFSLILRFSLFLLLDHARQRYRLFCKKNFERRKLRIYIKDTKCHDWHQNECEFWNLNLSLNEWGNKEVLGSHCCFLFGFRPSGLHACFLKLVNTTIINLLGAGLTHWGRKWRCWCTLTVGWGYKTKSQLGDCNVYCLWVYFCPKIVSNPPKKSQGWGVRAQRKPLETV